LWHWSGWVSGFVAPGIWLPPTDLARSGRRGVAYLIRVVCFSLRIRDYLHSGISEATDEFIKNYICLTKVFTSLPTTSSKTM
jgi:hypothetical protein